MFSSLQWVLCSSLNWTFQRWKKSTLGEEDVRFVFVLASQSEDVAPKTLCKEDRREFHQQQCMDPKLSQCLMKLLFKVNKWDKKPPSNQCRLESIAHEYYEFVACERLFPSAPERNKGAECRELLLHWCLAFTKGRVALFPGTRNNWCVYTINGREQSTSSGEICTPQHYHLLLLPDQAVHRTRSYMTGFTLCPLFFVLHSQCSVCQYFTASVLVCSTMSLELAMLRLTCSVTPVCVLMLFHVL